MIIKLKIECVRGWRLKEKCVRIVAMDDAATLLDLHDMIQDAVDFDRDHPFDFYLANSGAYLAERTPVVPDIEDWEEMADVFGTIHLRDLWPMGRKKLYYRFDFGDNWIFEIRKLRALKSDVDLQPRQILERIGPNPEQYPLFEE